MAAEARERRTHSEIEADARTVECMARKTGHTGSQQLAARAAEWLDDKLIPILGPPPLGPYGEDEPRAEAHTACPLCGQPLAQHRVERDGEHSFMHCPAPYSTQIETGRAA